MRWLHRRRDHGRRCDNGFMCRGGPAPRRSGAG
jgi:hypothetical protein